MKNKDSSESKCCRFKCKCPMCKTDKGCHSKCCKFACIGTIVVVGAGGLALLWLSSHKNKAV